MVHMNYSNNNILQKSLCNPTYKYHILDQRVGLLQIVKLLDKLKLELQKTNRSDT